MRTGLWQADYLSNQVDFWVREAIWVGVSEFDDLLRRLPGVFPVDVAASIRRLSVGGVIPRSVAARLLAGADYSGPVIVPQQSLPVPHPLDYDWRFTSSTCAFLLQEATGVADPCDTLVCLGTPSVYEAALRQSGPRRAVLVDANPAVARYFLRRANLRRVYERDLLTDAIPALRSSVIVADPPWYLDYMAGFLWAASEICMVGGHVLLSLPPKGTRLGVVSDVNKLLDDARAMGFSVTRYEEGILQYESPPFERNALRAAGVRLASYDWRFGDLYVLRLHAARCKSRLPCPQRWLRWDEEGLFGMRVRLRQRGVIQFADPCLVSLVPGDVLPSVSRRHPLRSSVDVWTAENRVFSCAGTNILRQVIRALARGQDPVRRVASALGRRLSTREKSLVLDGAEQVSTLAKHERTALCFASVG